MEKLYECEKITQVNMRVIARKCEKKFNLNIGLNESEEYFHKNYCHLSSEEKDGILQNEKEMIEKIINLVDIEVFKIGRKYLVKAGLKNK